MTQPDPNRRLSLGQDQGFFARPYGREEDLARDNAHADGIPRVNLKAGAEDFDETGSGINTERGAVIVTDVEINLACHLDQTLVLVLLETKGGSRGKGNGRGIRKSEGLGNVVGGIAGPLG